MTKTILALDLGTSMIKAVVVSPEGRTVLQEESPVRHDANPGLDQESFWTTTRDVISRITEQLGPDQAVGSVIATGQGDGLWMLRADGSATPRAYLWNSTQGRDVIDRWTATGVIDEHFDASGTILWSGSQAALWVWFREDSRDLAKEVTTVFCAKDFINFRLTGVRATDPTDSSIPFLNPMTGTYEPQAFERLDCSELIDLVPPIVQPGEHLGNVTEEASRLTGLAPGTPVFQGALDVVAMLWGSGLGSPGDVLAVLGTTAASMTVTPAKKPSSSRVGATIILPGGRHLRVLGSSSGTATLEWYLGLSGYAGDSRHQEFWTDVDGARDSDEIFIPYLNGERAPLLAPYATGSFLGLTTDSGRGEMGRAVAEGVVSALRLGIDAVVEESGLTGIGTVVLAGGGSQSPQWSSQVANSLGAPALIDGRNNLGALGVAQLLITDTGHIATTGEISVRTVEPDHHQEGVQRRYALFREAIAGVAPLWKKREKNQ